MAFFDGLHSYEVVLLGLGALFFLMLAGVFLYLVIKGKPVAKLLLFFVIPIVMMGFPGIKSFEFKNGVFTLNRVTAELQNDPTNASLRNTLAKQVATTSERAGTNPSTITAIAGAQFALGDHGAAEANLKKVLQAEPRLPEAAALQKRIELDHHLAALAARVEQHPDAAAKADLQKSVAEASHLAIASPLLLSNVAHANAIIGNRAEAVSLANRALAIDPNLAAAKHVISDMAVK